MLNEIQKLGFFWGGEGSNKFAKEFTAGINI